MKITPQKIIYRFILEIKVRINYIFSEKLNIEQKEKINNTLYFQYIKRKYKKNLNNLPTYTATGEFGNKVWWCWLQGEESAPELNRVCLQSLKQKLIDREIIVITEENYKDYIQFPDYIEEKYKRGIISKTHFSDLIRLELLVKYGGTWIDSSVLCTEYIKDFFDIPLFVFQNWKKADPSIVASNWFITAEKRNPIITTTRDLLFLYWKKNNRLAHYFIFHFFFTLSTEKYQKEWKEVPRYPNSPPHILKAEMLDEFSEKRFEQIKNISSFHKVTQKLDKNAKVQGTFYEYVVNHYLEDNEKV